ncbi:MAG: hypothetical protein MUD12_10910 [Spirochaetes bacterium]|jgi:hypothetical protein|nr:hypothetical protein [Spirochaetota bacterium]
MPSEAAQVIISIIPIVGIVMGCVVIFFYMLWNYRHKMLLIERNLFTKTEFDLDSFSLFAGLLLFCVGAGLTLFFLVKEGVSYGLLGGLMPLFIGTGMIIFFIIRMKTGNYDRRGRSG